MAHTTVMEWERVLAYTDGRLKGVLEPGRHRYRKARTKLIPIDMRPRLLTVPGQELITGDGISVRVSVTVTWQVTDPVAYTTGAEVPYQVLYAAVQDAIRERVAGVTLDQALANRSMLSEGLAEAVQPAVSKLGVQIVAANARDLMLAGELRRAAMETVVARERGKAELERARAEAAALRALANTARLFEEHPALLQLRTLQTAAEPGTTLVVDHRLGDRRE